MTSVWPWLAVAAAGALHGLNPATGWLLATAWCARAGDRPQTLRALLPIGVGHLASVALVAGAVALGRSIDRGALQAVAVGLLIVAVSFHLRRRTAVRLRAPAGHAALALGSFAMASAHGAGLMLVPALVPLCAAGGTAGAAGASGPLTLAIAAIGVHAAAMLAVTALVSKAACVAIGAQARSSPDEADIPEWPVPPSLQANPGHSIPMRPAPSRKSASPSGSKGKVVRNSARL
jgi:hypothetical protein